jgi:hypothetical protein
MISVTVDYERFPGNVFSGHVSRKGSIEQALNVAREN